MWLLTLQLFACGPTVAPAPVTSMPEVPAITVDAGQAVVEVAAPKADAPPPRRANLPPDGWVDLAEHIPGIRLDIRYHTANNFSGAPLPGYGVPGAWLQQPPADALRQVQADLAAQGLGLLVYDAYRPLRGTKGMVAWAQRTDQVHLLNDGYIARRSGHNQGNTIDLTVVDATTGDPLDMGTPWDTLDERSHTRNASGAALDNRLRLRSAMQAHGWRNYSKEWWHYTFAMDGPLPHRDVPYACFEAPEGGWDAPPGWAEPGYAMPMVWEPAECREPG